MNTVTVLPDGTLRLSDETNLRKWITALESNKYTQIRGAYFGGNNDYTENNRQRCAVGVLVSETYGEEVQGKSTLVIHLLDVEDTNKALDAIGEVGSSIVQMNDDERRTFPEIATYLRHTFNIPKEG